MNCKGIIFDLDGTLVNTLEDIADSMNRILIRYNFPTHDLESYKVFVGNGIRNMVKESLPKECREEEIVTNCFKSMMEDYREPHMQKVYEKLIAKVKLLIT